MTFNLDHFFKDSVFKYSHILGRSFNTGILGDIVQSMTAPIFFLGEFISTPFTE